jgi:hypothetical protein
MVSEEIRHPPSAEDALLRLLVLMHVVRYALLTPPPDLLKPSLESWDESDRIEFDHDAKQIRDEFWAPVRASPLWDAMSPEEKKFAATTVVTMSAQQHIDFTWRLEAMQVLMWAMELLPSLPPYDAPATPELLDKLTAAAIGSLIDSPRLRPREQIEQARSLAELWHWRSRTRELIEQGCSLPADPNLKAAGLETFDDVVRATARLCEREGSVPVVAEDFAAYGKAYRDLSPDEWSEVRSVTIERHFTLNWLCGYAPGNQWDETPTDT